jgi:hypothetical protein
MLYQTCREMRFGVIPMAHSAWFVCHIDFGSGCRVLNEYQLKGRRLQVKGGLLIMRSKVPDEGWRCLTSVSVVIFYDRRKERMD